MCAATGRPADAITAWAASDALRGQGGAAVQDREVRRREDALRQARQELGPDRARTAEQRGAAMSPATAAEYALMLTAPSLPPAQAAPGSGPAQRPGTGAGHPGRPGPHRRADRRTAVHQHPHRPLPPGPDPGQDRLPPPRRPDPPGPHRRTGLTRRACGLRQVRAGCGYSYPGQRGRVKGVTRPLPPRVGFKYSATLRSASEQILKAAEKTHTPSVFDRKPGLWGFATQNDIESEIIKYIHRERPPIAKMLEFSTATTGSILRALREVDANIYLLAANPVRVSGWHQARMRRALADLLQIDLRDYGKFRLRLYSVPPSLRGRSIGSMIVTGWYTHRDNERIEVSDPASVEVWGHDNAIVAGWCDEPDGAVLSTWFSREFDRLWRHRQTLDEAASVGRLDTEP